MAGVEVQFGEFKLELSNGTLLEGDRAVPLQDKPLELLKALLERPGELVTREALKARLWPDNTFVDFDNNLNATVKKLRDALGDSAESPRFIRTVPRRGYCFAGTVTPVRAATSWGRSRFAAASAAVVGAAVVVAIFGSRGLAPSPSPPERPRLVVLPFKSLSPTPRDELLADGISEEISTHLGRLAPERLAVIAHSSTLASSSPDELDVDYVLEGGVRGDTGSDRIRVTTRMVERDGETQVWSETFELDRDEAFRVPESVAVGVARALVIELLESDTEILARAGTTNATAHLAYLRGRRALRSIAISAEAVREARDAFREALELDPGFALAHVGLADVSRLEGRADDARRAAAAAIQIEPRLAEAHSAIGETMLYLDSDLEGASRAFERALALHPDLSRAHHGNAGVLAATGHLDAAIAEVERGLELDPLSVPLRGDLGFYFLAAGRAEDAVRECRGLLDASPGWARSCLVQAYEASGRPARAVALLKSRDAETDAATDPVVTLASLRRADLERAIATAPEGKLCPLSVAGAYGKLGENDHAMNWLEEAFEKRAPGLVFVTIDPAFDRLRSDPRFQRLTAGLSP